MAIFIRFLEKYTVEQKELKEEIEALNQKISYSVQNETDVDEFIQRIKKYVDMPTITREACYELLEGVSIKKDIQTNEVNIDIYYKLLNTKKQ